MIFMDGCVLRKDVSCDDKGEDVYWNAGGRRRATAVLVQDEDELNLRECVLEPDEVRVVIQCMKYWLKHRKLPDNLRWEGGTK